MALDQFSKKFIEEATDHVHDLEEALFLLEQNSEEKSTVERVFRAMHSLKGGGSMFGFTAISEITHHIETIYDLIRSDQMKMSDQILDTTFRVVDHLRVMLGEGNELSAGTRKTHDELLNLIRDMAEKNIGDGPVPGHGEENGGSPRTIYIHFSPDPRIMQFGNNPLFLIDELAMLGRITSITRMDEIPDFQKLDPASCYVSWDIVLVTDKEVSAIHDVFIFVLDDSKIEIEIVSDTDLYLDAAFNQMLGRAAAEKGKITLEELRDFVSAKSVDEDPERETEPENGKQPAAGAGGERGKNQISSIRVDSDKIDHLMNLVSELVTTQARLNLYTERQESSTKNSNSELLQISENVQKLTRDLRDLSFSIALIPISHSMIGFKRLVRDLSKELNKKVEFITEGTDTELDKNIIESLNDPILHILRNCLDHGIEDPATRVAKGKPETGTILFKAFYTGASVGIVIHNDGADMDEEVIRSKAVEKGLIGQDAQLSRKEILNLVFEPGFSTSKKVTDISGRGVGMDVVRRKISELRGEVEIDSATGKGTTVTIKLPLTLSIIDGLLIKIEETHFIIPLVAVHKIFGIRHDEIRENFNRVLVLDGEQIPYLYLRKAFGIATNGLVTEQAIVINYDDKRVAFVVDKVVGEYQAVLKTLGKHYKDQDIISGATILGDGSVALIMDTNRMVNHFFFTGK